MVPTSEHRLMDYITVCCVRSVPKVIESSVPSASSEVFRTLMEAYPQAASDPHEMKCGVDNVPAGSVLRNPSEQGEQQWQMRPWLALFKYKNISRMRSAFLYEENPR